MYSVDILKSIYDQVNTFIMSKSQLTPLGDTSDEHLI